MSLSDLASLGSFVSGLAVLVSLIFLYFQVRQVNQQVRQTEKNQQAAIRQTRTGQVMTVVTSGIEPSAAEALNKGERGEEDISEINLRQFRQYCRAAFWGWEDGFYQHSSGLFTDAAFTTYTINIRQIMRSIGFRTQWRLQRRTWGPEYVAWMDKLLAETPIDDSGDTAGQWRNALAAERSGAPY